MVCPYSKAYLFYHSRVEMHALWFFYCPCDFNFGKTDLKVLVAKQVGMNSSSVLHYPAKCSQGRG